MTTCYEEARAAIEAGKARAHALWMLLMREDQRDGFALKPMRWEGPGEYQRVEFIDSGDSVLVKLPYGVSLPMPRPANANVQLGDPKKPYEWEYSSCYHDGGGRCPIITNSKGEEIVSDTGLGLTLAQQIVVEHNLLHWIINNLLNESQLSVIPPGHACMLREFKGD